jgi:hypothetical protein
MKKRPLAHVPSAVTAALQETACRLAELESDVITAATWAFCMQDEMSRQRIVADFWFKDHSELGPSRPPRKHETFKGKVHALATYCDSALRRCLAPHGPGPARQAGRQVLPDATVRGRTPLVHHLPPRKPT